MTTQEPFKEQPLHKTISIHAPAAKVWDSLTNPELIPVWMSDAPITVTSGRKAGSPVTFNGDFHGLPYETRGTILQFEPNVVYEYSFWNSLSQLPDVPENYALITFRLTPEENGTVLTLTQSNFVTEVIYQHFNFYWNVALGLIKKLNEQVNYV